MSMSFNFVRIFLKNIPCMDVGSPKTRKVRNLTVLGKESTCQNIPKYHIRLYVCFRINNGFGKANQHLPGLQHSKGIYQRVSQACIDTSSYDLPGTTNVSRLCSMGSRQCSTKEHMRVLITAVGLS